MLIILCGEGGDDERRAEMGWDGWGWGGYKVIPTLIPPPTTGIIFILIPTLSALKFVSISTQLNVKRGEISQNFLHWYPYFDSSWNYNDFKHTNPCMVIKILNNIKLHKHF